MLFRSYQSVPNLKKICQTSKRCTRYIQSIIPSVSFLVQNCIFLSYELHIPIILFPIPLNADANVILPEIELLLGFFIPLHSVHQAQHDLSCFAIGAPASYFARLSWVSVAGAARRRAADEGAARAGGNGGSLQRILSCLGADTCF